MIGCAGAKLRLAPNLRRRSRRRLRPLKRAQQRRRVYAAVLLAAPAILLNFPKPVLPHKQIPRETEFLGVLLFMPSFCTLCSRRRFLFKLSRLCLAVLRKGGRNYKFNRRWYNLAGEAVCFNNLAVAGNCKPFRRFYRYLPTAAVFDNIRKT